MYRWRHWNNVTSPPTFRLHSEGLKKENPPPKNQKTPRISEASLPAHCFATLPQWTQRRPPPAGHMSMEQGAPTFRWDEGTCRNRWTQKSVLYWTTMKASDLNKGVTHIPEQQVGVKREVKRRGGVCCQGESWWSQQASPPLTGVGRSIVGEVGVETVWFMSPAGVDSHKVLQAKFMLLKSSPFCWFLLLKQGADPVTQFRWLLLLEPSKRWICPGALYYSPAELLSFQSEKNETEFIHWTEKVTKLTGTSTNFLYNYEMILKNYSLHIR